MKDIVMEMPTRKEPKKIAENNFTMNLNDRFAVPIVTNQLKSID